MNAASFRTAIGATALSVCVLTDAGAQQPPAQLPPQFQNAPADVRSIMLRQQRGEKISAADSVKATTYAKSVAMAAYGPMSAEVRALMEKAMRGERLTPDEEARIRQSMMAAQLKNAPLTPEMKQMIQKATSGQKPTDADVRKIRSQALSQARGIAAHADSLVNPCPPTSTESPGAEPATLLELTSLLREIVSVYSLKVGKPLAGRLEKDVSPATGAGLWMMGQTDAAIVAFARAALASLTPRILNNLGAALNNGADHRRALLVLGAANRAAPGSPAVLTNMGIAYAGMGQRDRAITQMRSAIASQPDLAQARFNLSTVLRCGGGASGSAAADATLAVAEAQQGQVDWFSADEDAAIALERAATATPAASTDEADSKYTPKRPKLMTLGDPSEPRRAPGGDVAKPPMPGNIEEYASMWTAGVFVARMKMYAASEKSASETAALMRTTYARERQTWLAGATPTRIRMPISNDAALLGLSRRRRRMFHEVGISGNLENQDVAPVTLHLSQAWETAMAEGGGTKGACSRILPAAREAYSLAKGAVSANANRVDMIVQDYAKDAAYWIGEIQSPRLADAARAQVAGDADGASAILFGDAATRIDAVASALYCAGADKPAPVVATAATPPSAAPERCKLPSAPLNLGVLSVSVGCDGLEFGVDAGLSANLKLDRKTRSGTIFFGAGAKVPTGWDTPVTALGAGAVKAGGQLSAEGKAGMIFKFDAGGVTDAGFEFGMKAGAGASSANYQVDISIVGGLQLSPDMTRPLDALADKMWGPANTPPAATTKP